MGFSSLSDFLAGVDCDISIGNSKAVYDALVTRQLCAIDERMPALVRLLKMWASGKNMNDASQGSFSSASLMHLVSHFKR